jgi:RNA polymerase sigma factor (sigma-70 family)
MLDIGGIGSQKLKYRDYDNNEFLSLSEYTLMAKKIVSKLSAQYNKKLLNNDDVISYVANAIMMADWRWDEDYKSKEGRKKDLYSYRNQCAIWAVKTLMSKKTKKKKIYSLDDCISSSDDRNNLDFVEDHSCVDPCQALCQEESNTSLCQDIKDLLDTPNVLNDKQKEYIKLYYFEGLTLEKIGTKFGVTREAVRQNINKGIAKLRQIMVKQ